jgi:hypothetical protein
VLPIIALSVSLSVSFQYPLSYGQIPTSEEFESHLRAQAEASKKMPDKAYLLIFSDVGWSAYILDSALDSFTQDGSRFKNRV